MNFKLTHNSLRVKLSLEELKDLRDGLDLEECLTFPDRDFALCVSAGYDTPDYLATFDGDKIALVVPNQALLALEEMGRSKDGVGGQCGGLDIAVQVDIRKDSRNRRQH